MRNTLVKLSLVIAAGLLAATLIAGFAFAAGNKTTTAGNPTGSAAANVNGYIGSKACLGCHTNLYAHWTETGHAKHMKLLVTTADFPADPKTAPAELQDQLAKAEYQIGTTDFFAKDGNGQYVSLDVMWDPDKKVYYDGDNGGTNWTQSCAGCHTVDWNKKTLQFAEPGIGCEACHGPGLLHVNNGKPDPTKIIIDTTANNCAQCHAAGAMPDGQRWPEGLKPGGDLSATSFVLKQVKPDQVPPASSSHPRQVGSVQASGHLNAMKDLLSSDHATAECAECHSANVRVTVSEGDEVPFDWKSNTDGVSCLACHAMHSPKEENGPGQLRTTPDKLCAGCHTGEIDQGKTFAAGKAVHHPNKEMLAGYGGLSATGTPITSPSVHSGSNATCVDCHMTDNNHMFKVIQPKDVKGTDRVDSCTSCHKAGGKASASNQDIRQFYLDLWQKQTSDKLTVAKDLLTQADAKLKATPNDALKAKRDIAYTNISFVEADGSTGAHNFEYVMTLLNVAQTNLSEVLK